MNSFHSLLCLMGSTPVASERVDLVARLPLEVASIVFRNLDDRSLLNASKVDDVWMNVIKSDRVLRTRLRRHVRATRECDPLNLKRFAKFASGHRDQFRTVSKNDQRPGFTAVTTFRIAENGVARGYSKPLKRMRLDGDAPGGVQGRVKIMRY